MQNGETLMSKLERGRAEFAYNCVKEVIALQIVNQGEGAEIVRKAIEKFKKKVQEDLSKNKIEEEKINLIFEDPKGALNRQSLSEQEQKVIRKFKNLLSNYRAYAKKIPQMIQANGLGQAIAFVLSKAKNGNAYELLYSQITAYLKSGSTFSIQMPKDRDDLAKWIISCSSAEYKYITHELLAFLNWLRRFAEGLIEEEEDESNKD